MSHTTKNTASVLDTSCSNLANVGVDFADGGGALAGTDAGGVLEVGRVLAALASASQGN